MCVRIIAISSTLPLREYAVYLLQAYDYAPDDPLICLSLAIASVGRAMQRQSDNRHHLITQVNLFHLIYHTHSYASQGMAFLSRYRELRGETAPCVEEVEYNFGRVFQQLGMHFTCNNDATSDVSDRTPCAGDKALRTHFGLG